MTEKNYADHIAALIRAGAPLTPPAVETLEPEIRSGDKWLLRDPFAGSAGGSGAGDLTSEALRLGAIGTLVVEWGYDVPHSRIPAFQTWLAANEAFLLAQNADQAKTVRYRGTYAVFSTTEKGSGQFRTVWSYRKLADLDALSDEYETGSPFAVKLRELMEFIDRSPGAGNSQQIYLLARSGRSPSD